MSQFVYVCVPFPFLNFSDIAMYRAICPQICPFATKGGGWQGASQLKLPSGGHPAILRELETMPWAELKVTDLR